jgi:hypothetical protein
METNQCRIRYMHIAKQIGVRLSPGLLAECLSDGETGRLGRNQPTSTNIFLKKTYAADKSRDRRLSEQK